ncbi:hypothetical protein KI387_006287, partial [Taxus chinensis]
DYIDSVLSEDGKNNVSELLETQTGVLSILNEHKKTKQGIQAAAKLAKVRPPDKTIADLETGNHNAAAKVSAEIFSLMALLKEDVCAVKEQVLDQMYVLKKDTNKLQ